jgi:hypothetical protein
VVVEWLGRTRFPDCVERFVEAAKLFKEADIGVLAVLRADVVDELFEFSPTVTDPHDVAAHRWNWPSDANSFVLEPLAESSQTKNSAASRPGPVNPEDDWRLSVNPHVEVERTTDVHPTRAAREAGDQGGDGRVIRARSGPKPTRQRRARRGIVESGHFAWRQSLPPTRG